MINVYWISPKQSCSRCRWDEWFVEDLLDGVPKRPAGTLAVRHHDGPPDKPVPFGIVVVPGAEWASAHLAHELRDHLRKFRSLILFITSDEGSTFPIHALAHRDMMLWVQTPRPEIEYPPGTTFFGFGSGRATWDGPAPSKTLSWFFAGQNTHEQRADCISALSGLPDGELLASPGFLQGLDRTKYLDKLATAWIAPAPGGPLTQDSFRLYEALEAGCIPIVNERRVDGGGAGYWKMLRMPMRTVEKWDEVRDITYEGDRAEAAGLLHCWWHIHRRGLRQDLNDQIRSRVDTRPHGVFVHDLMTVIVPTSPIPSHPSTNVIEETVASIRERTDAEILITIDGVRLEQIDRYDDYMEYRRRLALLMEHEWFNVSPYVADGHEHQAEMLRRVLRVVDSPYVLYVEHDTPLVGDVPFDDILDEMVASQLHLMRFSHEAKILDVHRHLTPEKARHGGIAHWTPTLQWSQRPHIASTDWYREILRTHFDPSARTMIEDVMHGVTEDAALQGFDEYWPDWRMAIYHPKGNIQRSTHTDGRAGDEKYPMFYRYPEDHVPRGAPWPTK